MAGMIIPMAASAATGLIQDLWSQEMSKRAEKRQLGNSKALMDYQQQKALEMWEATGYGAQKRQMKDAGLNPALMYGMGGGGGQSAGMPGATAGMGNVKSSLGEGVGMGMQMGLMDAQRQVLESQARLNNVEATKKAGVDTAKGQSEIELLKQGLDNERWKYEILKLEKALLNIQVHKEGDTLDEQIDTIEYNTKIAARQLDIITADATVSQATVSEKIKIVQAEAIGAVIKNEAARAGITLTEEQTKALKETVKQGWEKTFQGWQGLTQEQQKIKIDAFKADVEARFPGIGQVIGKQTQDAIDRIARILGQREGQHRQGTPPIIEKK